MSAEQARAHEAPAVRTGSLQAWSVAVRPKSLLVALSPVLVGGTLGFEGREHLGNGGPCVVRLGGAPSCDTLSDAIG